MNPPTTENDDLGIEYFDDVLATKFRPQAQPQTPIGRARALGVGGIAGLEEGPRQIARTGSRVFETVAGLPGDVKELFNNIMIAVPEGISGQELPEWRRFVKGDVEGAAIGGFGLGEPTSAEVREVTEQVGGEMVKPQSKWEEFGDEVAQDFAALALPVKGKVPFAKALGTSLIANAGGDVAKTFGGETAQGATKLGLLFAGGLIGGRRGGVKKYVDNLYTEMEQTVQEGATVKASNLEKKLSNIESVLLKGDPADPSKKIAFDKIAAVKNKIKAGEIDVDEVLELTKGVNESIFGIGDLKRSQNQLFNIRKALQETSGQYGSQNPEFLAKWKDANQAFAATQTSRKLADWVRKTIKPRDYVHAAGALGLGGFALGGALPIQTLGAVGLAGATAYSAEVMKRISQSPALRRYYLNVVSNGLKENKGGFIRNMNQLDKGLKKSFEESPFETITFDEEEIEEVFSKET